MIRASGIDRLQVVLLTVAVLSIVALFAIDLYGWVHLPDGLDLRPASPPQPLGMIAPPTGMPNPAWMRTGASCLPLTLSGCRPIEIAGRCLLGVAWIRGAVEATRNPDPTRGSVHLRELRSKLRSPPC
jgi:hypothetical protein